MICEGNGMYPRLVTQGGNQKGGTKTQKGGEPVDDKEKQTKELLEVLKKALESEAVERITITIKPNKKPKQS